MTVQPKYLTQIKKLVTAYEIHTDCHATLKYVKITGYEILLFQQPITAVMSVVKLVLATAPTTSAIMSS